MDGNATRLELDSSIDISSVMDLRQQLAASFEQGLPVTLAASAVERMDTAAVQLLYSGFQHAKDHGVQISWHGVSDGMKDAFRFAGLESWLNESAESAANCS